MAEFDTTGFSAVAAFFGESTADGSNKKVENHVTETSTTTRGSRRGVGASAQQKTTNEQDITKRLLQVGKRKRNHDNDNDEHSTGQEDQIDSDEEEGRTSIEAKTTIRSRPAGQPASTTKQSKKPKKDKQATPTESIVAAPDTGESHKNDEAVEKPDNATVTAANNDDNKEEAKESDKPKKKRKKVRSRQKNIYKDKRLAQHKPEHLILGRPNFSGRPMTAETRARLNLPPSKASRKMHQEDQPHRQQGDCMDGLAIDRFLNDEDVGVADNTGMASKDDGDPSNQNTKTGNSRKQKVLDKEEKRKKRKKPKKSKYKNLA